MELTKRYDEKKERPYIRLELTSTETRIAQNALALWLSAVKDKSTMTYPEKQVAVVAERDIVQEYPAGAKIRFSDMNPIGVMADIAVDYALHLQSDLGGVVTAELNEAQDLAVSLTFNAYPIQAPKT